MEDTLRATVIQIPQRGFRVLILVVMEDTLRVESIFKNQNKL